MYSESEINAKVAELKAYSAEQDASTAVLFTPLETALSSYFSASDLTAALRDVVKYMYNDIQRRTTVYETEWPDNLPTDFPTGYYDLRGCFYDFSQLMTITNAAFYAGFVFSTSPEGGSAVSSNTYLDAWTAGITSAASSEASAASNVAAWCKDAGGNSDLIDLLEDRGTVVSSMSREEIAEEIYVNRGVLEIINSRGLDVYVPSYL